MGFTSPHFVLSFLILATLLLHVNPSSPQQMDGSFPWRSTLPVLHREGFFFWFFNSWKKEYLSTSVLDCILHVSAIIPTTLSDDMSPPMIGSLDCEVFILSSNESISHPEGNHLSKVRSTFSGMLNDTVTIGHFQRLIIPKVANSHFYLVCFDFSVTVSQNDPYFFKNILVYDSM